MSEEKELSTPKGVASEIWEQLKAVTGMIFNPKALEPENEFQEFMRDAQAVLANLLSAFVHVVILLLIVQHVAQFILGLLSPKWINYGWKHIPPNKKIYVFLLASLAFVFSLRRLLIIVNFIRSYRIVAAIGTLIAIVVVWGSLPKLFAAESLFEIGKDIRNMIITAISK